jgi:hypothetical protein
MTLTIVKTRAVTGGVDTHAGMHVAAALDAIGGLLGVSEFPATPIGYAQLLGWLKGFGPVCLVGIEGTGSYGAGLARHVTAAGIRIVEVDRSDRQDRRRQGKSDPLDAVSAARAALSGRASGAPRGRDGQVEAIRALMVAKRTARAQRTQAINQARALIITGPDDIRARFTGQTPAELVADLAAPPRPVPRRPARAARPADCPAAHCPRTRPAAPARGRPGYRRHIADRGRRPPRAAALGGCLGPPMRLRADPRLLREGDPAPAEPRRGPAGQPRLVADRHHPDELAPANPRLRHPARQRRPVQA